MSVMNPMFQEKFQHYQTPDDLQYQSIESQQGVLGQPFEVFTIARMASLWAIWYTDIQETQNDLEMAQNALKHLF